MAPRRRRAPTARSASPRGTPTAIASTASHSAGSGSRSTLRRPPVCYLKPFIRLQTHKIKSTYVRVCACSRPLITHQHTLFSTAIASTASDLAGSDSRSTLTNRYAFLKPLIQTNTRSYFSICISFYSYLFPVVVYDDALASRPQGFYTGTVTPPPVHSPGSSMLVLFGTAQAPTNPLLAGFAATWKGCTCHVFT